MHGTPIDELIDGSTGSILFLDPTDNIELARLSGITIIFGGGDVANSDFAGDPNCDLLDDFDMVQKAT